MNSMKYSSIFNKVIFIIGILVTFSLAESRELSLEQFLLKVNHANPLIHSLTAQVNAQQASLQNTATLPDPYISYESAPNPMFKVNQKLNNPFKTETNEAIASSDLALSKLRLLSSKRIITAQAKNVYFKLFAIDKIIGLTIEEESILNQVYQSSLKQYEANRVSQQDPLSMSIMRSEAMIKIEQLKEERRSLLSEATRLAGGEEIQLSFPETLTSNMLQEELDILQQHATNAGNVDILMASIELSKTNQFKQLANISSLFEYELGASYDNTMGTFGWMAGLTLPLWTNKNNNFLHTQESIAESASANLQSVIQQVKADTATLFFKIDSAERILPLYKNDLIPKAKQARNLAQTSYQSGQLSLSDWATAEQRYLTINGQYFQLLSDRMSAEANLNQIIGR